jgi:hypothetical protein
MLIRSKVKKDFNPWGIILHYRSLQIVQLMTEAGDRLKDVAAIGLKDGQHYG